MMSRGFLDTAGARIIAFLVLVAATALIAYYHRADLLPPEPAAADAGFNPEFVACRDKRVGEVDKMRADGLIGDAQVEAFRERALAFCTAQFPPDRK